MRRIATLTAAALIGVGALATTGAEARGGGALAAGLIGGIAAGVLLGAAASQAQAAPAYGYAPPAYGPAPSYGAPVVYRRAPVRTYVEEDVPVYRPRHVRHRDDWRRDVGPDCEDERGW